MVPSQCSTAQAHNIIHCIHCMYALQLLLIESRSNQSTARLVILPMFQTSNQELPFVTA